MSDIVGCIFVCNDTNRCLLLRRSNSDPKDYYRGYWSILTGHMDEGELPYQSMGRETSEEIGIDGNNFKFNKCNTYGSDGNKKFHLYYSVVPKEFEPKLDKENMDYRWCSLDEIPRPIYPGTEDKIKFVLTLL